MPRTVRRRTAAPLRRARWHPAVPDLGRHRQPDPRYRRAHSAQGRVPVRGASSSTPRRTSRSATPAPTSRSCAPSHLGPPSSNQIEQHAKIPRNLDVMLARLDNLGYITRHEAIEAKYKRAAEPTASPTRSSGSGSATSSPRSRLDRGRTRDVLTEIEADLDTFMGPAFEDCCRDWLGRHAPAPRFPASERASDHGGHATARRRSTSRRSAEDATSCSDPANGPAPPTPAPSPTYTLPATTSAPTPPTHTWSSSPAASAANSPTEGASSTSPSSRQPNSSHSPKSRSRPDPRYVRAGSPPRAAEGGLAE